MTLSSFIAGHIISLSLNLSAMPVEDWGPNFEIIGQDILDGKYQGDTPVIFIPIKRDEVDSLCEMEEGKIIHGCYKPEYMPVCVALVVVDDEPQWRILETIGHEPQHCKRGHFHI